MPVDSSGAVGDKDGIEYGYFGQDNGDHLAFADDQDFLLDSFVSGKKPVFIFQGLVYWWRGSGPDKSNRFEDTWIVTKEKIP